MRYLKTVAALFIGLIGWLAFLNNLLNIDAAVASVAAVIAAPEQPYYQVIGPTFDAGWHAWVGLAVIMAGELTAGTLGFLGAASLFRHRKGSSDQFQRAKVLALAGGAVAVFVWFGLFVIVGELYFNMWQTEIGLGSTNGAFRYGTVCAVLLLFIALRED